MAFVIYLGPAILSTLIIVNFNELMLLLVCFILWASFFTGLKGNVTTWAYYYTGLKGTGTTITLILTRFRFFSRPGNVSDFLNKKIAQFYTIVTHCFLTEEEDKLEIRKLTCSRLIS